MPLRTDPSPSSARRGAAALGTIGIALAHVVRYGMHPGAFYGLPDRPAPRIWIRPDVDDDEDWDDEPSTERQMFEAAL